MNKIKITKKIHLLPYIYVDADGCPVKQEIYRIAKRYGVQVYLVSNTWIDAPLESWIEVVVVSKDMDAADNWIVEHIVENDIVISSDIPLASRCLKKGAHVIDPRGYIFQEDTIGDALANRELMSYLRDMGMITKGQNPFNKQDRSRFLQRMEETFQKIQKIIKTHSLP